MDRKEVKNHPQQYNSLEQLIEDAYSLNPKQLEQEMEWAEQELKSPNPLNGRKIPEPPQDEFQNIKAEIKKRNITPRLMADFDEESQKIFESGDFRKIKRMLDDAELTLEEHKDEKSKENELKKTGSKIRILLQSMKVAVAIAACFMAAVVVVLLKPGIDVVGKKNYTYQSRMRENGKGDSVWNNQEDYIIDQDNLDKAYITIKNELSIAVLKLNYLPQDVRLSELTIEERHAKLRFINKNNFLYVLEVLYPIADSANRFSDRNDYRTVFNEWIEKDIFIQKNQLTNDSVEYSAYFENANAYYYLQAVMDEEEFIKIVSNLSLVNE